MTAPLSGMVGSEANAAEQSRMELQAKLNGLGGINGRQVSPEARAKKLREACEGFESIFIQKMWQEMRNAVPKTGILSGREERFWQDMYDQELSKSMTKAGGIGLADMMYEQLSRNLVSASRSAAGITQGAAFTPSAAPLVREQNAEAESPLTEKLVASIYDGEAAATGEINESVNPAPLAQAPQTAQPVAQAAPVATQPTVAEEAAKPERKHVHKADLGQASGLQMAQKAKRDAGDKLGSRAVRPSQRKARQQAAPEQTAPEPLLTGLTQAGDLKPGSPEAIKAAMELAKSGAPAAEGASQPLNLNNLVANVQAMNSAQPVHNAQAAGAIQPGQAPANGASQDSSTEPVTRTVRFTTNIPKQANTSNKKTKQAIRMLNVDNVGANSKQGKGLAAYHAQQEAARSASQAEPLAAQPIAPLQAENAQMQAASAPIPPLTPQSQNMGQENDAAFTIPPLTAAESRS